MALSAQFTRFSILFFDHCNAMHSHHVRRDVPENEAGAILFFRFIFLTKPTDDTYENIACVQLCGGFGRGVECLQQDCR
ncbi:hypothetical protein GCM10028808_68010 [Spirosoma migulaei]